MVTLTRIGWCVSRIPPYRQPPRSIQKSQDWPCALRWVGSSEIRCLPRSSLPCRFAGHVHDICDGIGSRETPWKVRDHAAVGMIIILWFNGDRPACLSMAFSVPALMSFCGCAMVTKLGLVGCLAVPSRPERQADVNRDTALLKPYPRAPFENGPRTTLLWRRSDARCCGPERPARRRNPRPSPPGRHPRTFSTGGGRPTPASGR